MFPRSLLIKKLCRYIICLACRFWTRGRSRHDRHPGTRETPGTQGTASEQYEGLRNFYRRVTQPLSPLCLPKGRSKYSGFPSGVETSWGLGGASDHSRIIRTRPMLSNYLRRVCSNWLVESPGSTPAMWSGVPWSGFGLLRQSLVQPQVVPLSTDEPVPRNLGKGGMAPRVGPQQKHVKGLS